MDALPRPRLEGAALAVAVIAAVLLPPLGVFLVDGIGRAFWICLVLTLIGFVPGLVFALYVLFTGASFG